MNEKIRQLEKEILAELKKIEECEHVMDKPFYDPETKREEYGIKVVGRGSDIFYEPEGYRDVKNDRWTRKCKICGYEQHTNTQKPIFVGYEPSF